MEADPTVNVGTLCVTGGHESELAIGMVSLGDCDDDPCLGHPYCGECIDVLMGEPTNNRLLRAWVNDLDRYLELIEQERESRPAEAKLADEIKRLRTVEAAAGELIDALNDELRGEVGQNAHVLEHIEQACCLLDGPYLNYVGSWL